MSTISRSQQHVSSASRRFENIGLAARGGLYPLDDDNRDEVEQDYEQQQSMEGEAEEDDDGSPPCLAAAIENRAKEVGVAMLDPATLTLELSQFVEPGRQYTSTLLHLAPRAPRRVITVGGAHHEVNGRGGLNAALRAALLPLAPAPRAAFDDARGRLLVAEAAAPGRGPSAAELAGLARSHYLAFGAAGALLQHLGAAVAPGALRVECTAGAARHCLLDHETVAALDLVAPVGRPLPAAVVAPGGGGGPPGGGGGGRGGAHGGGAAAVGRRGRVAAAAAARFSSLLSFLDHTATACGARLLRANILQVCGRRSLRVHATVLGLLSIHACNACMRPPRPTLSHPPHPPSPSPRPPSPHA